MLDYKAIQKAVAKIVEAAVGVPAHIAYPNVGAPEGPYCEVGFPVEEGFGQAIKQRRITQQDFTDITRTQKVVQISLNFYRDGALAAAGGLREANKRDHIHAILWQNKLGWYRLGPVNNLSALQNANQEERAQVGLYLACEDVVEDTVLRALGVKFTTKDEDGHVLAEGEVNGLSS